jgi:hypothetical protein
MRKCARIVLFGCDKRNEAKVTEKVEDKTRKEKMAKNGK